MNAIDTNFHPTLQRDLRTLKCEEAFLVERPSGCFETKDMGGLYFQNCRYVCQSDLFLDGAPPVFLDDEVHPETTSHRCEYTNPEGWSCEGSPCGQGVVFITRTKTLTSNGLKEELKVRNYGLCPIHITITLKNCPDFEDMFETRHWLQPVSRDITVETSERSALWEYLGKDNTVRRLELTLQDSGYVNSSREAEWSLTLEPSGCQTLIAEYRFLTGESSSEEVPGPAGVFACQLRSPNPSVDRWLHRSAEDLEMLCTTLEGENYPYAGLPWFSALFGRDALWVALESLWMWPKLARGILKTLARFQAHHTDPSIEAEPGKVLHERRPSERTIAGDLPFLNYYGAVDGTSLFVIAAARYWRRTQDEETLHAIWSALEEAMGWLLKKTDSFLEYSCQNELGLTHQGWRDAEDAYFDREGNSVKGSLSLAEAQGYRTEALREWGELLSSFKDDLQRAETCKAQAQELQDRFEVEFWWADKDLYYPALLDQKTALAFPCSSNGHVLWAGSASPERAHRVSKRLFASDFWSGWGIRTVSESHLKFNPLSYHNGGVWPHDTMIGALGAARYGNREPCHRAFQSLHQTATAHPLCRLPELFSGLSREDGQRAPLRFATACSPQAWACVVPFGLLRALLGLRIEAKTSTVYLDRPELPDGLDELRLLNLEMGGDQISFCVYREEHTIAVKRLNAANKIRLVITY